MQKVLVENPFLGYTFGMTNTASQFPLFNGQPVLIENISGQWAWVSFSDGSEKEVRLSQIDFNREDRQEKN